MGAGDEQFQISNAIKERKIEIRQSDRDYRHYTEAEQEATRRIDTYHLTKQLGQTDVRQLNEEDRRNKHQRKVKLSSIRAAIREKIQRRSYKKYDRAVQARDINDSERKLKLHHALGQKFADEGKDVLEIDCAGSSFDLFRKEYTGFHGKGDIKAIRKEVKKRADRLAKFAGLKKASKEMIDKMTEEEVAKAQAHMDEVYGEEFEEKLDEKRTFKFRQKVKISSATGRDITRLTLSGPGMLDRGTYKIENTKDYVIAMAKTYIDMHLVDGELKHDVVINLQGHSRGGVSAGKAAHILSEWLNSPECTAFSQHVTINLIQRDPVPGADSMRKEDHEKLDLRRKKDGSYYHDPHLNVTSIASIHSEHSTLLFTPQEVRGQQRIVVMGEKHGVGLDQGDGTQKDIRGETKWHEMAGIDAATMQAYRGSGYSELGNGVWLMDEDNVLVRMRSYGEAMDVLRKVTAKTSGQVPRHEIVAKMIKNWFIDNEFVDEHLDAAEFAQDLQTKVRLEDELYDSEFAGTNSEEMIEVKVATLDLRTLMKKSFKDKDSFDEAKAKIESCYDRAIAACRDYMEKKDPVTDTGKMHLEHVSRLLSIYRQEKLYLEGMRDLTYDEYKKKGAPVLNTYLDWLNK